MEQQKTDRELIAEKNYAALYNRYTGKIFKESFKVPEGLREDFRQEAYFCVVDAVDGADLSRNFESFNTLLHLRLFGLRLHIYKKQKKEKEIFSSVSIDEASSSKDESFDSKFLDMCQNKRSELYAFSPDRFLTEEKENDLKTKYNEYRKVLPELHRRYMDLKKDNVSRKEMAEKLGVKMRRLSILDHEAIMVMCEVFDMSINGCRKPELARRVMNVQHS